MREKKKGFIINNKVIKNLLLFTSIFLLIINILVFFYLNAFIDEKISLITGKASLGIINLCVNIPPKIIVNCNNTLIQNSSYFCLLNASDINNNFTFYQKIPDGNKEIFPLKPNGIINFTPTNDDVGNWSTIFIVYDNSGCSNGYSNVTFNFSVKNINDAPFLVRPLPDINISINTTLHAFYLNDYFADPDRDVLIYNASFVEPDINFRISSSSEVIFSPKKCLNFNMQFFASDPYNLTAKSNIIRVNVICENKSSSSSSSIGSNEGSGSGGGGSYVACKSEWECLDWSECLPTGFQWRRCYDINGCKKTKYLKKECVYQGEKNICEENWVCSNWSACFINNTQSRSCSDLNNCGTSFSKPPTVQNCEYQPTCFDGIKNGNETGVDCGGSCKPCPLIESPAPIETNNLFFIYLFLLFLFTTILLYVFRDDFFIFLDKLLISLSPIKKKEILLDNSTARSLLESAFIIEEKIFNGKINNYSELSNLSRKLLLFLGFNFDVSYDEFDSLINHLRTKDNHLLSKETKTLLSGFLKNIGVFEKDLIYNKLYALFSINFLITLIKAISDLPINSFEREFNENLLFIDRDDPLLLRIIKKSIIFFRALEFDDFDSAKKIYALIYSFYELLTVEEKEFFFNNINTLFFFLKYFYNLE